MFPNRQRKALAQEFLTDKETLKESCIILSLIKTIFRKLFGLSKGIVKKATGFGNEFV